MRNRNIISNPKTILKYEKIEAEIQEVQERENMAIARGYSLERQGRANPTYLIYKNGVLHVGLSFEDKSSALDHLGFRRTQPKS